MEAPPISPRVAKTWPSLVLISMVGGRLGPCSDWIGGTAANALAGPLRNGRVDNGVLRAVQKRRQAPTRIAQRLQGAQTANLARMRNTQPPLWTLRLLSHLGPVKRLLGRIMGLGLRREHIRTDEAA
jgi:hypothetical protein